MDKVRLGMIGVTLLRWHKHSKKLRFRIYLGGTIDLVSLRISYIILYILQHVINFIKIHEKELYGVGLERYIGDRSCITFITG